MYGQQLAKAWAENQGTTLPFFRDDEVYGGGAETFKAASLRRAHSAEFSALPPPRQPAADYSVSSSSSSSSYCDGDDCDETASLESDKSPDQTRLSGLSDVWSPIMCQKFMDEDGGEAASFQTVPYLHPLANRPFTSLSDWSLEICTERLGSENGSDGFFSCPHLDTEDDRRLRRDPQRPRRFGSPDHCASVRKSPPRSFPPPLSSLSPQIQSRRENGRLVMEAVSQPSPPCLRAERHGGRLLLTLVGERSDDALMGGRGDVRESESDAQKKEVGGDEVPPTTSSSSSSSVTAGAINAQRLAVTVEKPLGRLAYRSEAGIVGLAYFKAQEGELFGLAYRHKSNRVLVDFEADDRPKSQPPRRRVARLISPPAPNDECRTRKIKNGASPALNNSLAQQLPPIKGNKNKPQVVLLNGETTEYMVPLFRGCNPPPIRRSVLIWQPYPIATSS